ncbi:plant invertase/pectin methylesterase inhibitor protein [Medicago truncatula]|uniref:Plant invertase/pectin methylesterase inhibitor protein n=1 Tax=Medicago truncatula TaxID=3880 RepID=A0A072VJL2_MEDTR|nr:plant invertase/pectin methylesterase inhibitor protein [Medicago truncatula]
MIFVSHAISPTPTPAPSPKLYQNVCKAPGQKDFEQRCLKLIEAYPKITLIEDYLTFVRSFLKNAAIKKAVKSQQQVKEIMKKYPSSQPIKECVDDYNSVVGQLKVALIEEPDTIDLDIKYASDALGRCEDSLAREKNVNTESSKNELLENIVHVVLARNHSHSKMVLKYNSQKPFPQQNGFGVQLTETISFLLTNCVSPKLNDGNGSRSLVFFTCLKPLSKSNGFGVQLTETISTAKWFWHSSTVIMMNDGVDDEIEDSSGDDDERR